MVTYLLALIWLAAFGGLAGYFIATNPRRRHDRDVDRKLEARYRIGRAETSTSVAFRRATDVDPFVRRARPFLGDRVRSDEQVRDSADSKQAATSSVTDATPPLTLVPRSSSLGRGAGVLLDTRDTRPTRSGRARI